MLEVNNMSVLIKDRFLVKNAFFTLNKGECVAIIGQDKSGKTSLIKAISGSLPIGAGQVFLDGHDIFLNKKVLSDVSTCFDPPIFFKYQSVMQNMEYLSSLAGSHSKKEILKALDRFHIANKANTKVKKLTYFEKKMMGLALGFLTNPKLLLLDEPFKNLPPENLKLVKDAIHQIRLNGTSIIITSTTLEEVSTTCDRYIFMEDRVIKKILTLDEVEDILGGPTFAFVKVKYPHYAGKLIMDNFGVLVKIFGQRVLFEGDETETAKVVQFLSEKKLAIYSAGLFSKKAEQVFASLIPFFKDDPEEKEGNQ